MRTQIYLRHGKEESLLRKHPWIFSGAIEKVKCDGELSEGEVVDVFTKKGDFIPDSHSSLPAGMLLYAAI